MGEADAAAIHRELGGINQALKDMLRRLDEIEQKQDKLEELTGDIKHMRANIAMMKAPIEDYKQLKQRGIGGWTVITMLLGGATVVINVISYIVRAYVLGLGTP